MRLEHELLTATYKAFNARDIDAAFAMLHPDVDWPNGWEGGRIRGRENVGEYWRRQWAALDPHVEPLRFEDDPTGRTVVDVHQVVRDLTGATVADQIVQHIYSIREELIERMDIQTADMSKTFEEPA